MVEIMAEDLILETITLILVKGIRCIHMGELVVKVIHSYLLLSLLPFLIPLVMVKGIMCIHMGEFAVTVIHFYLFLSFLLLLQIGILLLYRLSVDLISKMAILMHQNRLCTCITRSLRKVQWVAMPRMLAFKVSRLMMIQGKPFGLVLLNLIIAATGTGILGLVNLSWVNLSTVVMISMRIMAHVGVVGISLARRKAKLAV